MKAFLKFLLFAAIIVVLVVLFTDSIDAPANEEETQTDEVSEEMTMDESEEVTEEEPAEDLNSSETEESEDVSVDSETELEGSVILGGDNSGSSEEETDQPAE